MDFNDLKGTTPIMLTLLTYLPYLWDNFLSAALRFKFPRVSEKHQQGERDLFQKFRGNLSLKIQLRI